jgi:hypothetical protein
LSPGRRVVGRRQGAAHRGADAEYLKNVAGGERPEHRASVDVGTDIGQLRKGTREHAGLPTERVELLASEMGTLAVWCSRPFDREHLVHVRHRIGAEEQRVEQRERRGHHAQPERHRGHDGECRQGSALESAECVDRVASGVVENAIPRADCRESGSTSGLRWRVACGQRQQDETLPAGICSSLCAARRRRKTCCRKRSCGCGAVDKARSLVTLVIRAEPGVVFPVSRRGFMQPDDFLVLQWAHRGHCA